MLEDRVLVWRLRRGDGAALRRIYEKYREDLLRVAAGLLPQRVDAEDVVHDVFIAFAESSHAFTLTGSLRGYLTTCVANKARNILRAKSRRRTLSLDAAEPMAIRAPRPDEWLVEDEEFRQLRSAMAQLPYEQREAVALHLQGAMKFKDIAVLQDASVKTVISRYRYGLDKLRSLLNGEVKK